MARMSIIKECTKIIENHCEEDFECYRVGYYLSYKDGKIQFSRVTTSPTGEESGWGYIDTKSYERPIQEWGATIEDYCNLSIAMQNRDELKYEYGEDIDCIQFKGIY